MKARMLCLAILGVAAAVAEPAAAQRGPDEKAPRIYVPQKDVAALIGPTDRAVLMDRKAFEKLLATAEAARSAADRVEVAQITDATYQATVRDEALWLTGTLTVRSLSDEPVAVPLSLASVGVARMTLGGKPAPLGYDRKGRLVLIVTGRGGHKLELAGSTGLRELKGGGIEFGLSLPTSTAGQMSFTAPGDLEVHATVPVASAKYDKASDRTAVKLAVGGRGSFNVVLMGNGRQEDRRAILLGTSAMTVRLTGAHESLNCLYTVQVLRRGVRELRFAVPGAWTITDVGCPSLVKWSVQPPKEPGGPKTLVVRLRTASRGTKALHVQATAPRGAKGSWVSPFVKLLEADFQEGYLLVDTSAALRVRGQRLASARQEDLAAASFVPGLLAATQGRLFYHWSDNWSVGLDLAAEALRRGSEARHRIAVTPEELALTSTFEITAIGREMFDVALELPPDAAKWHVREVTVGGKKTGFEYRVVASGGRRMLKIALAGPVRPEGIVRVSVSMRHVPAGWEWPAGAAARDVRLPIVRAQADTVSGQVAVAAAGDLDVSALTAPPAFKPVTVGRMTALGLAGDVRSAYTYEAVAPGEMTVRVSRRRHRMAADSVALVTATPTKLIGRWRVIYGISRARARVLWLLTDKSLGRTITITTPGRHLASKIVVQPGEKNIELPDELAKTYNLWRLTLDSQAIGTVVVDVRYDDAPGGRKSDGAGVSVPLVRPIGARQVTEMLAIQASDELDVTMAAVGATDVDAVDLPPLPAAATRLLRAFRLAAPTTAEGVSAGVRLSTKVHEKYAIPSALAAEASFLTYLGPQGGQRTEATFRVVSAAMQFLPVRLPPGAKLWSIKVAGRQAKPKRNDAGDHLVAMPRATGPQEVKVIYAWTDASAAADRVKLGRASLPGVTINKLRWNVVPPPGYHVTGQLTDMEAEGLHRPRLAGRTVIEGVGNLIAAIDAEMIVGKAIMSQYAADEAMYEGEPDGRRDDRAEGVVREKVEASLKVLTKKKPPAEPDATKEEEKPADKAPAKPKPSVPVRGLREAGRYTLPVELVSAPYAGPTVRFSALGEAELAVVLGSDSEMRGREYVGMVVVLLAGLLMLRKPVGRRVLFVAAVLAVSTLVAIWWPRSGYEANGAFLAALWLIPGYLVVGAVRWIGRKMGFGGAKAGVAAATAAMVLLSMGSAVETSAAASKIAKPQAAKTAERPAKQKPAPIVVPYEGDPTRAEDAEKVLVPYSRFVELWNRAHPDRKIDAPPGPVEVVLAGVHYRLELAGERMNVELTAEVKTLGKGWATLPMPMKGLAVTGATLDGKPAGLQVGPKGMALTLPGESAGVLKLTAVTTPKKLGRRGSVSMSLPPLPGAVLSVELPDRDLVLEAPGVVGGLSKVDFTARAGDRKKEGVRWTVPLGMRRDVTLRWSPKLGLGAADRTLSAAVAHDVHVFHWAMVGVSKVRYSFSAGRNDRFALLVPDGMTLTGLTGANLRDFRQTGQKTEGGVTLKVVEVRLHRPATGRYELTARWVGALPALDRPARLALPRAGEVGRESGTVSLHAAGGMTVKVPRVAGGRRSNVAQAKGKRTGRQPSVQVARYYWPYRPFALTVQLSREAARPSVRLDQLVRVDRPQVQLLVKAHLTARRGRLFGASFVLPDGYELLSAVGSAVEDHYEQPAAGGRRLHVNFRSGVTATDVALVLVRKDADLSRLSVPKVTAVDPGGKPLPEQTGRLAVQVAASLEAATDASAELHSIAPAVLSGWLNRQQVRAVQFAYRYEKPAFSLRLKIRPQRTKVRLEVFGALTVRATSAWYSYRLRYRIEGTPIDQVRFTLPTRHADRVAVFSPAMRSVTKAPVGDGKSRTAWTVALVNEVTGTLDVTVNFAAEIDAATSLLDIPRIDAPAPAGQQTAVEAYRAIVAVQNASRHKLRLTDPQRLAPLPPTEQRKLLAEPIRKNLQFVLQSFEPDWSAMLAIQPAKATRRIEAVVDLLAMETVVDRSGRCRYEATLELQNRTRQFLRVRVPKSLTLWSATVAGQPVKPVTDKQAAAGVVLIPLVKTSPGGLPYQVKLYLAGPAGQKLGLMAELAPPAIRIEGILVERTTWTLRLPEGYRYLRPGGNLSPVVAVEKKIAAAEARLGQIARSLSFLTLSDYEESHRTRKFATDNWKFQNEDLEQQVTTLQREVDALRTKLGEQEYKRLKGKVGDLSKSQYGYNVTWARNVRQQRDRRDVDINTFVNNDAVNPGLAEVSRNARLNTIPDFVRSAAERQKVQITQDLVTNAGIIKANQSGQIVLDESGSLNINGTVTTLNVDGRSLQLGGQRLLVADTDDAKKSQVVEVLGKLQWEQQRQQEKRQVELQKQLTLLDDNRLVRYFNKALAPAQQVGQGQAATRPATVQPPGGAAGRFSRWGGQARGPHSGRPTPGTTVVTGFDAAGNAVRVVAASGDSSISVATGGREGTVLLAADPGAITDGKGAVGGGTGGFRAGPGGTGPAVTRGTFSLPISLPAGGVRRDFQGPYNTQDGPTVTLLAVDERLIEGAYGTAAVLVAVLVAWLISLLWRQLFRPADAGERGYVPAYVLLAGVLGALVFLGGLSTVGAVVLFAAIACPAELLHRLLARRAARRAAA